MLSATPARVHVIARFDTWLTLIALALTGLVTWGDGPRLRVLPDPPARQLADAFVDAEGSGLEPAQPSSVLVDID
jgi:hypothetical protein